MKKINILLCFMVILLLCSCSKEHVHDFSGVYEYDSNGHYHQCECMEIDEIVVHSGGAATCTKLAICDVCGCEYGKLIDHELNVLSFDDTYHWYSCDCGFDNDVKREKHMFDEGVITLFETDKNDGIKSYKCVDCEYTKEETIPRIKGYEVDTYPSLSNADIVSYKGKIYTYGGSPDGRSRTNSIYCYDTINNKLYKLNVKLKKESTSHRVVLIEDKVYIFGGLNSNGQLNTILVHDLTNQTLKELDIKMPFGANCFQVGYYNDCVYFVGGSYSNISSTSIFEFNINTLEFVKLDVTLPLGIFKGSWCSVDNYMYLIGGTTNKRLNTIIRFDMKEHTVKTMNAVLPINISQLRTVNKDGNIYIFGGTNDNDQLIDDIYVYNTYTDECIKQDCVLPLPLANTCVTKVDECIYILGGDNDNTNIILKLEESKIISLR